MLVVLISLFSVQFGSLRLLPLEKFTSKAGKLAATAAGMIILFADAICREFNANILKWCHSKTGKKIHFDVAN